VLPRHIGGVESSTEKPQLGLDEIRFSRMLEDFARAQDVGRSGRTSLSGNSSIDAVLGNCERDGLVGLSVRFALR
jgi:hypothetical protein